MRARFSESDGLVSCTFEREESDLGVDPPAQMARQTFTAKADQLPHPDLLGLIALLCARPWIGARLALDRGVSVEFAEAVLAGLGVEVEPVDRDLTPRRRPKGGRPALAFSGGTDCTAALTVMPPSTVLCFLDRTDLTENTPPAGLYRKDAALASLAHHAERGTAVRRVECDLEFVRQPIGFPHDLANAVPALFQADADDLSSITWGSVLESTYRIGSARYRDYARGPLVGEFGAVFDAVGLPMANVVAGVSEVGTAMLVRASPHAAVTASCIRGTADTPCGRCWKCARKLTLDCALEGQWLPDARLHELLASRDGRLQLTKTPVKHEGVVAFMARTYARDRGTSPLLRALVDKTSGYPTGHFTRHYSPALAFLPTGFEEVAALLDAALGRMSGEEEDEVRAWDLRQENQQRADGAEAFLQELAALDGDEANHRDSALEESPPALPAAAGGTVDLTGAAASSGSVGTFELVQETVAAEYVRRAVGPARLLLPDTSYASSWQTCAELVDEILARAAHATVVEFGSGVSTVWTALALQRRGGGRVVSFEHDHAFAERTDETLRHHGVREMVDLRVAPLVSWKTGGNPGSWYDEAEVTGAIADLAIDILFVDGPPGSTGALARYPAIPVLNDRLASGATVILDDFVRPDERRVRDLWMEDPTFASRVRHQRAAGRSWVFRLD